MPSDTDDPTPDQPVSPTHRFDDDIEMASPPPQPASQPPDPNPKTTSPPPAQPPTDDSDSSDISSPISVPPPFSEPDPDPDLDLYTKLSTSPSSVPGLVTDWLAHVQVNGPAAVAELISLPVRLARPTAVAPTQMITSAMVVQNDPPTTVAELAHVFRADEAGPVPAVGKDGASRRVRRAYEEFWRRLPVESSNAVLFDTDCFETLVSWLDAMAGATSRALRMAACFAAYRLTDGLIEFGTKLRKELASMRKQLATEKRKCGVTADQARVRGRGKMQGKGSARKALSEKGKEIANKVEEWSANNAALVQLADRIFSEIYVIKYRDVSPDIRALSVTSLGSWIVSYPDHYLDDTHNKYIGWLLYDKDANVRKSSLEVLLRLLRKNDFFSRIQIFMTSFTPRIVEMSRDRDDVVAVEAIRVLTVLSQYEALEWNHCEEIRKMVVQESQSDIRRAAGEFLATFLFPEKETKSSSSRRKKAPTKRRRASKDSSKYYADVPPVPQSCEVITELLRAITEADASHGTGTDLAVDAVWDHVPALRCWEAFITLIGAEDATKGGREDSATNSTNAARMGKKNLTDKNKAVLCEILVASAREASGQGDPVRKVNMARQFDSLDSPGAILSTQLLPALTQLLMQFQADAKALSALVQLPMYFDMNSFEHAGNEKHFEAIVMKLIDITSRHTGSPEIVKSCANTFKVLLSNENPLRKLTMSSLHHGSSAATKDLSLHIRAGLSKSDPLAVSSAALRVRCMSELIEPSISVYKPLVQLLEYQLDRTSMSELSDDVTTDAIRIGCAVIIWSLSRVRSRMQASTGQGDAGTLSSDEIEDVGDKGSTLTTLFPKFCSSVSFPIPVRIQALQSLLAVLTLARGVERIALNLKVVIPQSIDGEADNESRDSAQWDLLRSKSKIDEFASAVRTCVIAVLDHELKGIDGYQRQGRNGRTRERLIALPESTLTDCFASLVQSSFQSVLAGRISHLPILGLVLRRRKAVASNQAQPDWTAYQLCRKYCQQRRQGNDVQLRDELKALRDAAEIFNDGSEYHVCRELAEAVISTREPGQLRKKACKELLEKLIRSALNDRLEFLDVAQILGTLSSAGFALVTNLSTEDADDLLANARGLSAMIEQQETLQNQSETELFETFCSALKMVSRNETPEVPRLMRVRTKLKSQKKKTTKKRRKVVQDTHTPTQFASAPVETVNVRRSQRERKKVDYARLVGMKGDETDEELESSEESSLEDENEDPDDSEAEQPQVVANIASKAAKSKSSLKKQTVESPSTPIPASASERGGNQRRVAKETSAENRVEAPEREAEHLSPTISHLGAGAQKRQSDKSFPNPTSENRIDDVSASPESSKQSPVRQKTASGEAPESPREKDTNDGSQPQLNESNVNPTSESGRPSQGELDTADGALNGETEGKVGSPRPVSKSLLKEPEAGNGRSGSAEQTIRKSTMRRRSPRRKSPQLADDVTSTPSSVPEATDAHRNGKRRLESSESSQDDKENIDDTKPGTTASKPVRATRSDIKRRKRMW